MRAYILALFFVIFFLFPSGTKALTINFVTDIHASNALLCNNFKCLPSWRANFQEFLDNTSGLILTVGDNMDKPNKNLKNELIQMATGREIYWANGNHDHNMYIGGRKHYVVDKDDWRIVILKAGADKSISELKWLKKQLTDYKDKKVIVLEHQPIFRQGTTKILSRHKKIEKIYEQYSVDYVFSGHWHGDEWSRVVNGVTYRTLRGLTYGLGSYYYTIDFE